MLTLDHIAALERRVRRARRPDTLRSIWIACWLVQKQCHEVGTLLPDDAFDATYPLLERVNRLAQIAQERYDRSRDV